MPETTITSKQFADLKAKPELTFPYVKSQIPKHLFAKSELSFLVGALKSAALVFATAYLAYNFVPLNVYTIPIWIAYAILQGTFVTGLWVLGHDCGHGAFSNVKWANDVLGFLLHTPLLVPYYCWKHSHSIHHSRNHHIFEDETHVPSVSTSKAGKALLKLRDSLGEDAFAIRTASLVFTVGWPAYILFGATGGPARGFTSHVFVPNKLFPTRLLFKVCLSNFGVGLVLYSLYKWAQVTSFAEVMALYIAPYLVLNFWLTLITWLQHTEEDLPYFDDQAWEWLKGAMSTIDRSYHPALDALHHHIGTTHVVHHIFADIPYYNAVEATRYLKEALGDKYRYDHNSVWSSLCRIAKFGPVEERQKGVYWYITDNHYDTKDTETKKSI